MFYFIILNITFEFSALNLKVKYLIESMDCKRKCL